MSAARLGEVFGVEFSHNARRPLFWMLILTLALFAFELSNGHATISSGNAAVGGTKAWITSEFAVAQLLTIFLGVLYAFFVSVAGGMAVIRDDDLKIGELLHSTPLRAGEYVWGKFLAHLASFVCVLLLQLGLMMFFNHVVPHPSSEVIGPLVVGNYLRPALLLALPTMVFFAGTSFAFGEWTRRPILVFVLPVVMVLVFALFLWDWSPSWLSQGVNLWLQWLDPAGVRWLGETWLKVDRGVAFYNKGHIGFDTPFALSRVALAAIGLVAVAITERRFASHLRGARVRVKRGAAAEAPALTSALAAVPRAALTTLGMRSGAPTWLSGAMEMARVELQELRSTPGLYLFAPIILLQTLGGTLVGVGAFDTPLLNTPGTLAASLLNTLTLLLCLLLLFYTTESLQRERSSGLASIAYATPLRTVSLLLGKAVANTVVALVILLAALLGCGIVMLVQGKVPFALGPFALVWGALLIPTLLLWTTFVSATFALSGNRYTTYGVGLVALSVTGYFQARNHMNWVFNWDLWNVAHWTDMGVFELDRVALVLNRILALGLSVLFVLLTLRWFPRREPDATRMVHRLRPAALGGTLLRLSPALLVPLVVAIALALQVQQGFEGGAMKKLTRDYWKRNVATWKDAELPAFAAVDLDLTLEPERRSFQVAGTYRLVNTLDHPLARIPLTGGASWDSIAWTMNGAAYRPEDRSKLYVFTPPQPLAPGDSVTIGFRHGGRFPRGVSKNGGRTNEFILPAAAVLTGFDATSFVPILGFIDGVGVEDENRAEPRDEPDDFYEGVNPAGISCGTRPFATHILVHSPAAYQVNATGIEVRDVVQGGRRTSEWRSDQPVMLFNVVAGKWAVKKGPGVEIDYFKGHPYNVDEMMDALVAARRYYSEWFTPYPWRDLRLSEFPNLATYAQGSPTNITFSEGIGFLTKSEPKANAAFCVTAHEAAHQWWGNIVMPAKGPGNEILAEGMAHYSTLLLTEQARGLEQRIAFARQIESNYGNRRVADSERSLLKVDNTKPGDNTVIYDKAGWVYWMMQQLMGRDAMLAGLREFIARYRDTPDHATVHDFLVVMRRHAPDPAAYDAFVDQWFHRIVVPEYKLSDATRAKAGAGWDVHVRVRNDGTGTMPVEVAVARGERFGKADAKDGYRDARATIVLAAGESKDVVLHSDFEPERVLVDPDYLVLQLKRRNATLTL
jgi:ABC-type transport system involved in multi-copper enzyme maturation permease subunit